MAITTAYILALDVGEKRIGLAIASLIARLPRPLTTLQNDTTFMPSLQAVIGREKIGALVVGLPRGMDGQSTKQTQYVTDFVAALEPQLQLPIYFQDEALTSQKAEAELEARRKPYQKGDVDALAATYILEDYLRTYRVSA